MKILEPSLEDFYCVLYSVRNGLHLCTVDGRTGGWGTSLGLWG